MADEEENASRFGSLTKRDRDRIIQTQVDILLHKGHIQANDDTLQYHIEYILLIKLVRMLKEGTLTFEKYQRMKMRHREDIRLKLRRKEILSYDFDGDVYGRLDAAMEAELRRLAQGDVQVVEVPLTVIAEEQVESTPPPRQQPAPTTPQEEVSFTVHLDGPVKIERGPKSSPEQDAVVKKHVQFMLDEAQPPVKPRKLQQHIEHVIMIRLGSLLHEGHLDFQAYSAEKDKLRAELMSDFENYDTAADIYTRLDQDLMATAKKPKKKGDPEPDRDAIIQKLVGELLKEAKITHGNKKDLRHHEEHILLIRLGGLLNSGRLTYTKYVEMKSRHHAKMRQKLLDNEIEYYSFDTDVFGKLDKLILVEIEIIINKEKEEAERVKSEREAKWLAEKLQQEQERQDAIERAKQRREEKEAQAAREAAELKAEEEAAEAARQERLLQEAAERAQREAEEAERLEQEKKEKEEKAAAWRAQREEEERLNQERIEKDKVVDYFPEQRSLRKKDEEKIVIKPNLRAAAKFGDKSSTVTTQFVETTQEFLVSDETNKEVKWDLSVNQSEGEQQVQKEQTIQKLEFERTSTSEDPASEAWTLKVFGSDHETITSAITHSTQIVTNITAAMQETTDHYINVVWSTDNTPQSSPAMSRKNDQ